MHHPIWKKPQPVIWKFLLYPVPYSWGAAVIQIVTFALFFWWFRVIPPPGFAVAALAIAATIMAVRGQRFTRFEEIAWFFIAFCFFFIETRAITNDRAENNRQQAQIRKEERDHFTQTQQQFLRTLNNVREGIQTETGGDSFCYVQFVAALTSERGFAMAVQKGKFPLYGVHVRIVDLEKINKQPVTLESALHGDTNLEVGDMAVGTGLPLTYINFSNNEKQDFNLFFSGRNGLWTQLLRMRNVSGRWQSATKVTRSRLGNQGKYEDYPIFEKVDPQYPRVNGAVVW